jgi:hypothetical protein
VPFAVAQSADSSHPEGNIKLAEPAFGAKGGTEKNSWGKKKMPLPRAELALKPVLSPDCAPGCSLSGKRLPLSGGGF